MTRITKPDTEVAPRKTPLTPELKEAPSSLRPTIIPPHEQLKTRLERAISNKDGDAIRKLVESSGGEKLNIMAEAAKVRRSNTTGKSKLSR